MLRLIEAIFAGKIATEKIDVNGHPRMRGELHCVGSCDGLCQMCRGLPCTSFGYGKRCSCD